MRAPVGRADGRGMQVDASERAQQMGAVSVDPIPPPSRHQTGGAHDGEAGVVL